MKLIPITPTGRDGNDHDWINPDSIIEIRSTNTGGSTIYSAGIYTGLGEIQILNVKEDSNSIARMVNKI